MKIDVLNIDDEFLLLKISGFFEEFSTRAEKFDSYIVQLTR
jgi:hypothetical protein